MIERFECTDVGRDCSWSTFAATEPQLMQQIAEHAKKEHNIQEIPYELKIKVESVIKDV